MTVVDRTSQESPTSTEPVMGSDAPTEIDLRPVVQERSTGPVEEPAGDEETASQELRELRELRFRGPKGLRIRRIRIKSVIKIATVFSLLGYLVTIGTLVALWNVALRLGFVDEIEQLFVTSLGLDGFEIVGQDLFELATVAFGILFAIGLVIVVLLTVVYNATCALFGGLAVETGSLRRPKRVFSLRHRRFITVR